MRKEIRVRCWIFQDGERFFGPGKAELLSHIAETGSLSQAARAMGMSYKKAWVLINEMNEMAKKPLILLKKGGSNGGGAELTAEGERLLSAYSKLAKQLDAMVAKNTDILKLV
jgi:molybdate transport system regulatory protein